ncbi:MAG: DUF438 domain-containing protein [Bacillota bacterium]|nr:DUF438 domain-containing protein [Bacillota bacterium]
MSELIDNHRQRRETLKQIILGLHEGQEPNMLKEKFKDLLQDVGATEISQLEQELIEEGLKPEEIKKLCDVHAAVFKESLDQQESLDTAPGHPVHTFKKENRALENVLKDIRSALGQLIQDDATNREELWHQWQKLHLSLMEIEKHYSRKENILFPFLEKYGITGPPSVMWALHDDIRDELKKISRLLAEPLQFSPELKSFVSETAMPVLTTIEELIYKEENILFPMCLETLAEGDWGEIYSQSGEIGFSLIQPDLNWQPDLTKTTPKDTAGTLPSGKLKLDTGILSLKEISLIFNHLPIDITFVDNQDVVRYYSHGPDRAFERTPAIIGRKVQNCHPPDSVHVVNKIVEEFKKGENDRAEFWLNYNGMYLYITYHAVRDENGAYQGTLEVTQNIKPLQQITGEKRILD